MVPLRNIRPTLRYVRGAGRYFAVLPILTLAFSAWPVPVAAQDLTAFVGVTIVPMTGGPTPPDHASLAHQTVLVRDGRIAEVGPEGAVDVPAGAHRIDGRDRWLAPGLIDSHVHLFSRSDLDLYLANGVTTIVNLGGYGAADSILAIRRAVLAGELAGPTIYTSGNWLDGDPPARGINTVVRTPEEGRREVRRQHEAGYDFIKVYVQLASDVYDAILAEAERHGIPVTGHVPGAVGVDRVLAGRQQGIEHAAELVFRGLGFEAEASALESLARRVARDDVAVTSTLWMLDLAFKQRTGPEGIAEVAARPEMRYLPSGRRAVWRDDNMFARFPPIASTEGRERVDLGRRFTAALVEAGARVHAGTDADVAGSVPGFSMHEELRSLVAVGLSPYEALRAATSAPGDWLGAMLPTIEPFGTIEPGRRADLVLLDADPLEDVANLRRLVGVMTRGRWHPVNDLASRLERAAVDGLAPAQPPGSDDLTALRTAWTTAYEEGDAHAMRDLYTNDAVRMPYDAPAVEGRDAIIEAYEEAFTGRSVRPRIELTPLEIMRLGNVAIERGSYDEDWIAADGTVVVDEIGKYISVARRGTDGRWRFAISIFNRDAAPS